MSAEAQKPFIIPLFIPHSGCPHCCAFCNQESVTGKKRLTPSHQALRADIDRYLRHKGPQRTSSQVAFYGGNFLGLNPEQIRFLLEAVQPYVSNGNIDGIRFSTRPDTITEDRLDLLNAYAVETIELGVQSMDDRILERVHRGHTAADTEKAVLRLKARPYQIGLQIMVGLPGEDHASSLLTGKRAARLLPDFVRIYPTLVLTNSLLAKWYDAGTYVPLTLDEAVLRAKSLYRRFEQSDIPVVRMGLQHTTEMTLGAGVLAGPHHPAFGELVYSALFFDRAVEAICAMNRVPDTVTLKVHPKDVSKMRGPRNNNLEKLSRKFGFKTIRVRSDSGLSKRSVHID